MSRIFLFGAGYSARAYARRARERGLEVAGTTRSPDKAERLREAGIRPILFDRAAMTAELAEELREATHLVVSIAPDDGDPVLRAIGAPLAEAMPKLRWVAYLSTVGVYGDRQGGWVNETAQCAPRSARSRDRVTAEDEWRACAGEAGLPLAILRLSGIYGPGRNAFVNLENGKAKRIVKPGQIFNRIHVDDIASALEHLGESEADGAYNVTDDLPAPPQDVVAYAAALMGVAPPPEIDFDAAQMTPMARSFYGESKRVSNARLKETGYRFAMPDYRVALEQMWHTESWRVEPLGFR